MIEGDDVGFVFNTLLIMTASLLIIFLTEAGKIYHLTPQIKNLLLIYNILYYIYVLFVKFLSQ